MAALKSVLSLVLLAILITVVLQSQVIESQGTTCSASLGNLSVCAPFVLPGTSNPSPSTDCCAALQSLDHDCICNTLRVAARLPSQCNLSPISCAAN
ncbi:stamen-specific protein FIL1 [Lycium barbarum]|uniref:stamen-specific protein FIL1 n=1 Tax=Lycium barbarum TaxID=112863 RepID=UPI00293E527E|nr:stamen-specific protein FIL1 [Lycium barbarum]